MTYSYSKEDAALFGKQYKLFLDLDGVLADFDKRVLEIFGKEAHKIHPGYLWSRLTKTEGFFEFLPWTSDGKDIWGALNVFEPVILTGVPRGKWAVQQKLDWCARELGKHVQVITCYTKQKPEKARGLVSGDVIPVLIDDRDKILDPWREMGGIFIYHKNAQDSFREFDKIVKAARAVPVSD